MFTGQDHDSELALPGPIASVVVAADGSGRKKELVFIVLLGGEGRGDPRRRDFRWKPGRRLLQSQK